MKRVRMTFRPEGVDVHPVYDLLTGGADYLSTVELINWNVAADPPGFLIYAEGDRESFADDMSSIPEVIHQEFIDVDDGEFYVYHTCEKNPMTDAIFDAFSKQSLLVAFPMEYDDRGGATVSVVGPKRDVENVLDQVPAGISVDIDAVGGPEVRNERILSRLSDRQFEALEAGLDVGYYHTPRKATSQDVAEAIGCAPSTASKHLRRAESKLINGLLGH